MDLSRQIQIWWLGSKGYALLIWRVDLRSNGLDLLRARERQRSPAGDKSRGGAARDSPKFTKIGAPGVFSTRAWVGCGRRVTRDAPGPKTGYGGALLTGHDCRGGSAQWSSPVQRVRAEPRLVQGCKVCARPLCGTGELVRGSCRAVLGCSKLATVTGVPVPRVCHWP